MSMVTVVEPNIDTYMNMDTGHGHGFALWILAQNMVMCFEQLWGISLCAVGYCQEFGYALWPTAQNLVMWYGPCGEICFRTMDQSAELLTITQKHTNFLHNFTASFKRIVRRRIVNVSISYITRDLYMLKNHPSSEEKKIIQHNVP